MKCKINLIIFSVCHNLWPTEINNRNFNPNSPTCHKIWLVENELVTKSNQFIFKKQLFH